jgi:hypothetical protein
MDAVLGSIKVGREKSFGSKTADKFPKRSFVSDCFVMRKRGHHFRTGGNPKKQ